MKTTIRTRARAMAAGIVLLGWTLFASGAFATTHYVDLNSPSPTPPYTTWDTAAHTIQDAVNEAADAATVLVNNGTYDITVAITVTGITVKSVNGAGVTIVRRAGGDEHCIFFLNHADSLVDGFSIVGGDSSDGGGVRISYGGTVRNCVIEGNTANYKGGGVYCFRGGLVENCRIIGNNAGSGSSYGGGGVYLFYGGTVRNCLITENNTDTGSSTYGGGVCCYGGGLVQNCTITDNVLPGTGGLGGGVFCRYGGVIENSIIYYNTAALAANYANENTSIDYTYCCTLPLPEGEGNIDSAPDFVNATLGDYRLQPGSPGIDTGLNQEWMLGAMDLNGLPRILDDTVDMGAYEFQPFACGFVADATAVGWPDASTVTFTAYVSGTNTSGLYYWWDFNDDGQVDAEGPDLSQVSHTYGALGRYSISLMVRNELDQEATRLRAGYIEVRSTQYVSLAGSHQYPFATWATAANNIQEAVDAAAALEGFVLVADGTYDITDQVTVTAGITVKSVNGAGVTIVRRTGGEEHRIFSLNHADSLVDGFSIVGGGYYDGGGVKISFGGTVRNCVIEGNTATYKGGGVYCHRGGLVENCRIIGNNAGYGSSYGGGGVYLYYGGTVRNCLITENNTDTGSSTYGGGVCCYGGGLVQNCTITDNVLPGTGGLGGGVFCRYGGVIENSIIYYNTAALAANYADENTLPNYTYCCTLPLPEGEGNIDSAPDFVNATLGDYRLQPGSPGIDTGLNQEWMLGAMDLNGLPRILDDTVDMGAYEFQPFACGFVADATAVGWPDASTVTFTAYVSGTNTSGLYYWWDFNDDGQVDAEGPDLSQVSHTYGALGRYSISLMVRNELDQEATRLRAGYIEVRSTQYVSLAGSHQYPFATWATAANNIQEAVDAAAALEGFVLVADGTYDITDQVTVTAGITVKSVNGAGVTIVRRTGGEEHRIFSLNHADSLVDGFSIVGGGYYDGGGVKISFGGTVRNCVIEGNTATYKGGGVYCHRGGLVENCRIIGNNAGSGSSYGGGGVYLFYGGTVRNCLITENNTDTGSSTYGGGVCCYGGGLVQNCTITDNVLPGTGGLGGGVFCRYGGVIENSIIYYNTAALAANYANENTSIDYTYCCTLPLPEGEGNIDSAPDFVNATLGDYRLQPGSPGIDTGLNQEWMLGAMDLNGLPRILDDTVDMGAYEFPELASVTTATVSAITSNSATSGGNVTSDGGAAVTARGVCWNTSTNPTTANSKTTDGTGTGSFTSFITGLNPGTEYHVRAYATNSAGTAYGEDLPFTTHAILPTVTTATASAITSNSATSGGNVTSDGGASVTARGVCWSTSANPTTSDSHTSDGTGTGSFSSSITGLTPGTTYHVRAYATNSEGTGYGSDQAFITLANAPGTASFSNVTQTSIRANWTANGNPTGTQYYCENTTAITNSGWITNTYWNSAGLTCETSYTFRVKARNGNGTQTGWTNLGYQSTQPCLTTPMVTTTAVSSITSNSASSGGNVTNDGGAAVTARGVCWSTSANPTTSDSHTSDGTGTGSFTSSITGLSPNTTYHVRAYATNSVGTGYGSDQTFTTTPATATKDELAIDFKTAGIYVYNTGIWNRIYQGVDPEGLCSFGTYLAVDFGTTYGLYVYDAGAWTRVHKGVAIEKMAGFGGKLAVDFGTSYPIYEYDFGADTWTPIYKYSSPRDTIEALGDKLVVDFKTAGIYVYDAGIWNRIYKGVDPVNIVSFGDKLAIDFGTAYGLYVYEYDTDNWTRVYKGVAIEKMSEIDGDLAVDFGTAYGLYVYEFDTDNWTRVYKGVAIEKMAGFDGNLAVDFGTTYPIYEYDFDTDNWNSIYQYSSPRDELVPANILD